MRLPRFRIQVVAALLLLEGGIGEASISPGTEPAPIDDSLHVQILGGAQVERGVWPDAAAYVNDAINCTGTLIAPTLVLTAAHCISGSEGRVVLDSVDLDRGGEEIAVLRALAYPNWQQSFDLGLLVLSEASRVVPRTIASECVAERHLQDGTSVEIVGFGSTSALGGVQNVVLNSASTSVTDSTCSTTEGCQPSLRPFGELVAGGAGVDTCAGDSGGPVYLRTPTGDHLLAVTSRGVAGASGCGQGGIYVRADAALDWIEQETGVQLSPVECDLEDDSLPGTGTVTGSCASAGSSGGWILALLALLLLWWRSGRRGSLAPRVSGSPRQLHQ